MLAKPMQEGKKGADILSLVANRDKKPDIPFALNEKHKPINHLPNTVAAITKLGIKLKLNLFSKNIDLGGERCWDKRLGRFLNNDIIDQLYFTITDEFGFEPTMDRLQLALRALAGKHAYNPVEDYLNEREWDESERIDTMLSTYFGAEDTPLIRAMSRKFMLGAVSRIYEPGVKFDTMLILEGSQGIGKSSGLRILAGADWFTDNVAADLHKADAAQGLLGNWFNEMSELDAMNRSQTASFKAFLSRQIDHVRLPYGKTFDRLERQCVFVGTTNTDDYQRDESGARRLWPVKCGKVDLKGLERDRDQLWAEACEIYATGEKPVLPQEFWAEAAIEQEKRRPADPWEDLLSAHMDGHNELGIKHNDPRDKELSRTLMGTVLHLSPKEMTRANAQKLKTAMLKLGFEYRESLRVDGDKSAGFVRPDPK